MPRGLGYNTLWERRSTATSSQLFASATRCTRLPARRTMDASALPSISFISSLETASPSLTGVESCGTRCWESAWSSPIA
eukprot:5076077-Prymnesium_polylepis.1